MLQSVKAGVEKDIGICNNMYFSEGENQVVKVEESKGGINRC